MLPRARTSLAALVLPLPLLLAAPALADIQAGRIAFSNGDYATAFREFNAAAEAGDSSGQYLAGEMLVQGRGVAKDARRGLDLLEQAARGGHVGAQSMAGALYAFGQDLPANHAKALEFLRPAAMAGDMHAQNNLAALTFFGLGTQKDVVEALTWAKRAAAKRLVAAIRLEKDIEAQATPDQIREATLRSRAPLPAMGAPAATLAAGTAAPPPPSAGPSVPVQRPAAEPVPPPASPTPPPVTSGVAPPAPAPGSAGDLGDGWVIQVGSLPSRAEAEQHWRRLALRQAPLLGDRQPALIQADLGARGIYTRVFLTGFADRAAAVALCERLKAAGTDCLVKKGP
ncbi:SPOR domain-containing protein [Niveispirillum fermenti]|uniref:SPOR domain-containing protein n=1 Tax=Niveispirillum fermenti TaxID=1233113 RepID=UPI003A86E14A